MKMCNYRCYMCDKEFDANKGKWMEIEVKYKGMKEPIKEMVAICNTCYNNGWGKRDVC